MRWQVTITKSTGGVPGYLARVHPEGVSVRYWVYAVHGQDRDVVRQKAASWCGLRSPETVLANMQRRREAAHAG